MILDLSRFSTATVTGWRWSRRCDELLRAFGELTGVAGEEWMSRFHRTRNGEWCEPMADRRGCAFVTDILIVRLRHRLAYQCEGGVDCA